MIDLADLSPLQFPAAEVQRRLRDGRCAVCDLRVPTAKRRRRTAICARCEAAGWHWCSRGQHIGRHADFYPDPRRPKQSGLGGECRVCRAAHRKLAPARVCQRAGCTRTAHRTGRGWHKLCAVCLRRYAWCATCGTLPRSAFAGRLRRGDRHAGLCRACDSSATGAAVQRAAQGRARREAVAAYALAHPELDAAAIGVHFGASEEAVRKLLATAGVRRGQSAKLAAARERWRLALTLPHDDLAAALSISHVAARQLIRRARTALAAGRVTLPEGAPQ